MKVLFISPPCINVGSFYNSGANTAPAARYAVYLLSAVAIRERFAADIYDFAGKDFNTDEVVSKCRKFDAVCISSGTLEWGYSKKIIEAIKKEHPGIPVIAGGAHPSLCYEHILKNTPVDFIIKGEGEKSLPRLLRSIEKKKKGLEEIPGVIWLENEKIIKNPDSRPLTESEFEHLPYPLFEKLPDGVFEYIPIETARGNPYYSPDDSYKLSLQWRGISPLGIYERAYRTRENFICKTKSDYIFVIDENFTACTKRLYELDKACRKNKEEFKLIYRARAADLLQEDIAGRLYMFTGRIIIDAGAGYNKGLRALKKGYNLKSIVDVAEILKQKGLSEKAEFSFMSGIPGESSDDAEKTIGFAKKIEDNYGIASSFSAFIPLPGTVFWDEIKKNRGIDAGIFDEIINYDYNMNLKS